ncbi:MAG: RpiB/LacA/LacB family sugar-phosphate isomerase [Candidatus Uhrbacteria bacterium]|nr:RpiB/LacA/LacB family sugar-phosphate isomerase [Patescibacteria group bacterium]MBU1906564.1 RpiB/LacA/LacB family sugar-phosphate isomerase [Patescibacteria group bacterium]
MKKQTIYLGADHAGFEVKEAVNDFLEAGGYEVVDMGNQNLVEDDDYPDFGHAVAKRVVADPGSRGIVSCGNAQGICIVTNKVKGVRAAVGFNEEVAETSRTDDDANILCLPGRHLSKKEALAVVKKWLGTEFSKAPRHERRLAKVQEIEKEEYGC